MHGCCEGCWSPPLYYALHNEGSVGFALAFIPLLQMALEVLKVTHQIDALALVHACGLTDPDLSSYWFRQTGSTLYRGHAYVEHLLCIKATLVNLPGFRRFLICLEFEVHYINKGKTA